MGGIHTQVAAEPTGMEDTLQECQVQCGKRRVEGRSLRNTGMLGVGGQRKGTCKGE